MSDPKWQLHNYSGAVEDIRQCHWAEHVDGTQRTATQGVGHPVTGRIKCANCDLWRETTEAEALKMLKEWRHKMESDT